MVQLEVMAKMERLGHKVKLDLLGQMVLRVPKVTLVELDLRVLLEFRQSTIR
jgi:hypothetical protein